MFVRMTFDFITSSECSFVWLYYLTELISKKIFSEVCLLKLSSFKTLITSSVRIVILVEDTKLLD